MVYSCCLDRKHLIVHYLSSSSTSLYFDSFDPPIERTRGWQPDRNGNVCKWYKQSTTGRRITVCHSSFEYLDDDIRKQLQGRRLSECLVAIFPTSSLRLPLWLRSSGGIGQNCSSQHQSVRHTFKIQYNSHVYGKFWLCDTSSNVWHHLDRTYQRQKSIYYK